MAVTTLAGAANICLSSMFTRWNAGTINSDINFFIGAMNPIVPDANANLRTVGNWLTLLQPLLPFENQVTADTVDYDRFNQCVLTVFRLCWQANDRNITGQISNAQAAAILAAFNANLA